MWNVSLIHLLFAWSSPAKSVTKRLEKRTFSLNLDLRCHGCSSWVWLAGSRRGVEQSHERTQLWSSPVSQEGHGYSHHRGDRAVPQCPWEGLGGEFSLLGVEVTSCLKYLSLAKKVEFSLVLAIAFTEIDSNFFVLKEWIDVKLRWNPDDYGGIKLIRVPSDSLWIPDIVLFDK